jgi:hypothetical protein
MSANHLAEHLVFYLSYKYLLTLHTASLNDYLIATRSSDHEHCLPPKIQNPDLKRIASFVSVRMFVSYE